MVHDGALKKTRTTFFGSFFYHHMSCHVFLGVTGLNPDHISPSHLGVLKRILVVVDAGPREFIALTQVLCDCIAHLDDFRREKGAELWTGMDLERVGRLI